MSGNTVWALVLGALFGAMTFVHVKLAVLVASFVMDFKARRGS